LRRRASKDGRETGASALALRDACFARSSGNGFEDNDVTRNNILFLVIGALAVGTAVLGYQLYQERQKPGLSISIGGKEGLKIEGK
jgi:hypothetical protein